MFVNNGGRETLFYTRIFAKSGNDCVVSSKKERRIDTALSAAVFPKKDPCCFTAGIRFSVLASLRFPDAVSEQD